MFRVRTLELENGAPDMIYPIFYQKFKLIGHKIQNLLCNLGQFWTTPSPFYPRRVILTSNQITKFDLKLRPSGVKIGDSENPRFQSRASASEKSPSSCYPTSRIRQPRAPFIRPSKFDFVKNNFMASLSTKFCIVHFIGKLLTVIPKALFDPTTKES
jgi:hypothetical protein